MNKQEALEQIERQKEAILQMSSWAFYGYIEGFVKQLDEPQRIELPKMEFVRSQKPIIPQFVADWIEESKTVAAGTLKGAYINAPEKVRFWWSGDNVANVQVFARAWLDGYEVEEEKKYKITLLNRNDGDLYLVNQNADLADKYGHFSPVVLLFTKGTNFSEKCYKLTKKEVVSHDFGWVFDCPGIKIEEVE